MKTCITTLILAVLLIICYFCVLEMRHKHFLKTVKVGDSVRFYTNRINSFIEGEEKFHGRVREINSFSKKLNKMVDYRVFYIDTIYDINIEKNEGEVYPVLNYKYGN